MRIFRYPDSDCDTDADSDTDPNCDCNTGRFPIRDAGLKEAPTLETVDVHVDVDGFYKSNSKGVKHTPENVKLLLPPRQCRRISQCI